MPTLRGERDSGDLPARGAGARLIPDAVAFAVETDAERLLVTVVRYRHPHGSRHRMTAKRVVLLTYRIEPYVARAAEATLENYARIAELLGGTEVEFNTEYGGNNHIMGTTIMGEDPANSVVDADCRCHDHPNLFIGGLSVFSTGGTVNCGLTIAALALRLADTMIAET